MRTDSDGHDVNERDARRIVEELLRRQQLGGDLDIDDLVAADMINHAAGPQGRDGLERILCTINHDLGPLTYEQHHLIADSDLVTQHLTVSGAHRDSTMPLLAATPARGRHITWPPSTFFDSQRFVEGH